MRREAAGTILPAITAPLRLNEWSDAYLKGVQRMATVDAGAAVPLWFPMGVAAILGFDLRPDVSTITSGVVEVEAKGIERLAAFTATPEVTERRRGVAGRAGKSCATREFGDPRQSAGMNQSPPTVEENENCHDA